MKNKHLTFLLAVLMSMAASVASAQDFEVDGIYYNITSSSTVAVTCMSDDFGFYPGGQYEGTVTIPESVTYNGTTYSVTDIGNYAFRACRGLTSVTIPNCVTSIGSYAFSGCSGLTSIDIPNSVTDIGERAFEYSSGLTSIDIPNSVTSIGDCAFYNCSSMTSVTIGNGVTSIGDVAFCGCCGLTSITIPNSVTSIGNSAFSGCSGLTSVTIPNSVKSIGSGAFEGSSWDNNLSDGLIYAGKVAYKYKGTMPQGTSIVLEEGTLGIAGSAFSGCSGLTSVTIPSSVTSIGGSTFLDCTGLTSVIIPNSVTSIGRYAFSGCKGLTSVIIPNSVISIGEYAFYGCRALTRAEFASIECLCGISFGDNAANPLSYAHHLYIDGSEVTDLIIPNSVTSIGSYAFRACSGLTSVTIPNSVTSIGSYAFSSCRGLTSVTIPNSVTSIGSYAFSGCSGLTSVSIGNSVTSIGYYAFAYCSSLTSITIPNSVTSIDYYAFRDCSALTSVTIPNSVTSINRDAFLGTAWYDNQPDGLVYAGKVAYTYKGTMPEGTNIVLEEGTLGITGSAFSGCSGLTSVTIPNGVTSIGGDAFLGCTGLTGSLTIPNSVTKIGEDAFNGCSGLTSVSIGNSVKIIDFETFAGCSGLTSVTIGNSVTSIGWCAFDFCSKIERINCRATTPPDCYYNSFTNVPGDCTLEVPVGCKATYETVYPWNGFTIVETEDPVEPATVTLAAEYGTFCSAKALDFTDVEGVKAYIASVFDTETGELTLTRVKKVKARTGLVLRGTPGQTYEIPEGTGTTVVANLLVGVTEDTELSPTDGNFTNFIMAKNDAGNIGFFRVGGTSTLKGGKAYLQLPSDELSLEVKGFRMLFDDGDMSDNVETIHNEQFTIHNGAGAVYDLQGRRVAKPTKGIYIVNGKKTVIK